MTRCIGNAWRCTAAAKAVPIILHARLSHSVRWVWKIRNTDTRCRPLPPSPGIKAQSTAGPRPTAPSSHQRRDCGTTAGAFAGSPAEYRQKRLHNDLDRGQYSHRPHPSPLRPDSRRAAPPGRARPPRHAIGVPAARRRARLQPHQRNIGRRDCTINRLTRP